MAHADMLSRRAGSFGGEVDAAENPIDRVVDQRSVAGQGPHLKAEEALVLDPDIHPVRIRRLPARRLIEQIGDQSRLSTPETGQHHLAVQELVADDVEVAA